MTQVNLSRLQSQLLTSGIQQSNNALYQVITQLLLAIQQVQSSVSVPVSSSGKVIVSPTIFLPGLDGTDGLDAIPGSAGIQGIQGPIGPIGIGIDGLDGDIGIPGLTGPIGLSGISGPPGLDGIDGQDGFFGLINQFQGWTVIDSTATGTQDNWDPGLNGNTLITWHGASDVTVSGFANGYKGQIVALKDTGTKIATFSHNSGSSTQKLFNYATSAGTPIAANGNIAYQYDGTQWQIISHEQGIWIDVPYSAGNFTASGSMIWTVQSGDQVTFRFHLKGRILNVKLALESTTVGGTLSNILNFAIPGGFMSAAYGIILFGVVIDNGATQVVVKIFTTVGATIFGITKLDISNYAASTDNTTVYGGFLTEIQ